MLVTVETLSLPRPMFMAVSNALPIESASWQYIGVIMLLMSIVNEKVSSFGLVAMQPSISYLFGEKDDIRKISWLRRTEQLIRSHQNFATQNYGGSRGQLSKTFMCWLICDSNLPLSVFRIDPTNPKCLQCIEWLRVRVLNFILHYCTTLKWNWQQLDVIPLAAYLECICSPNSQSQPFMIWTSVRSAMFKINALNTFYSLLYRNTNLYWSTLAHYCPCTANATCEI